MIATTQYYAMQYQHMCITDICIAGNKTEHKILIQYISIFNATGLNYNSYVHIYVRIYVRSIRTYVVLANTQYTHTTEPSK